MFPVEHWPAASKPRPSYRARFFTPQAKGPYMSFEMKQVTPVLRIFDVALAKSFYCDYLGCSVDWMDGDPQSGPVYLQVSRGLLVIHLSSHHGDGTPGGVVLVEVTGIKELWAELHAKDYRFMNPGLDPGPGEHMLSTELIDPFSNLIRFFERGVEP